ncbi:acyl-CoA dehydrogenase family protein [Streptomyces sp. NPDC057638]|uniref:acyl-CoA dehydrogenase family protein n=1 Tax=Streptomyces sp. NPDC057638 TaxID=3346190 RepID=UPI0036B31AB4
MDFRLGEDERALQRATRELLARLWPPEALRAALDAPGPSRLDRGLWRALGRAGLFALRLPSERGGVGLGPVAAVVVFEEVGRALLPGPLIATHLAAGVVVGAATGERVVTRVDGDLVPWLAESDAVLREDGPAAGAGGDGAGAGGRAAEGVPGAVADGMAARSATRAVPGAVALRSVDPLTPLHRLPAGAPRAPFDAYAALLTAAEQLGSAARTTEMAVRHAREREQFGRPIGSFQAVKHLCAEMLVRTETARAAVHGAAVTGGRAEIAGARLLADEAAVGNARDCLQIHGGMGFTWEAEVHPHLKRAWVRARLRPTAVEAEEILAEALRVVRQL